MLYDMWAAIALSTGNKAKARTIQENISIIVQQHYSRIKSMYVVYVIDMDAKCRDMKEMYLPELADYLRGNHGLSAGDICWLPVEVPFPDEVKEQASE